MSYYPLILVCLVSFLEPIDCEIVRITIPSRHTMWQQPTDRDINCRGFIRKPFEINPITSRFPNQDHSLTNN